MSDPIWQVLINVGPLVAFLALWGIVYRLSIRRQGGAVAAVRENTEQMRRLNANVERLTDAVERRAGAEGNRHG